MGLKNAWIGLAALGLALAGCNSPRPLIDIRADADEAFEAGQYDAALADYLLYVDRSPGDAAVQARLAETFLATNQPERAVEHAWRAYDLNPASDPIIETLALSMHKAEQSGELFQFLKEQTNTRGRVEDFLRLGRYSTDAGDADSAELAFKTAAELDKGRSLAPQLALAHFYRHIGDKEAELARLRMALYLDPINAEVNARLRELGEIPGPTLALRPTEAP
jgi:tetratricopeptide (TPR) repeat protein